MKNIFLKSSLLAVTLFMAWSCEEEDQKITVQEEGAPTLLLPTDGSSYVLNIEDAATEATTLVWDHAQYDVATVSTYNVEVALAGTEFAAPLDGLTGSAITEATPATTTSNRFAVWTVAGLNGVAINAGIEPFTAGELEIRVKSTLGVNGDLPQYSNVIKITVTPYVAVIPPLFMVGAVQGAYGLSEWDNTTAMPMRYIGTAPNELIYEAYVKVAAGQGFKFIGEQGTWDNGNYGTIGGVQDGNLQNDGGSGDIKVADVDGDGLYYVQVNISEMTYTSVKMNWGIIGSATPGAWADETAMAYDFGANAFSISTALADGELKFRAKNASQFIYSDDWKFNVGVSDPTVVYNAAAGNFPITAGTYNLTLVVNFDGTAEVTGL